MRCQYHSTKCTRCGKYARACNECKYSIKEICTNQSSIHYEENVYNGVICCNEFEIRKLADKYKI